MMGVLLVVLAGCTGIRVDTGAHSESYTNANGQTWKTYGHDGTFGISGAEKKKLLAHLINTDANAYAIKKDADTREMMVRQMKDGVVKESNLKVMAVINNDPSTGAYYYHPEISGMKIYVKPGGGFGLTEVSKLPKHITIYTLNGKHEKYRVVQADNLHHNGIKIDYRLVINKIN